MPIENRVGDIFAQSDVNVIAHQANLFHTFGGGIARIIGQKYPEAYDADLATDKGDSNKLGTYSSAATNDGKIVINCYSQTGMGATDRNTSYNDILVIFKTLEQKVGAYNDKSPTKSRVIGVPYKYGCGLAGGSWRIVNAIFTEVFKDSPVKLVIMRLPSEPEIDIS